MRVSPFKTKLEATGGFSELVQPVLLFLNFFLIITIYNLSKPIKGALLVSDLGAGSLPYVWITSALLIGVVVAMYGRLLDRMPRSKVFTLTIAFFAVTLAALAVLRESFPHTIHFLFYVWGDVFPVVLVEQFWSFTNDVFDTKRAKRWYGFIAAGSMTGQIGGAVLTMALVKVIGTSQLLYVCLGLMGVLMALTHLSLRLGEKGVAPVVQAREEREGLLAGCRLVVRHPYLVMILLLVMLSQVGTTLIDFRFNSLMQTLYPTVDGKTAYLANLNLWIGLTSLVMMLGLTRPLQKYFGVVGGLQALPISNILCLALVTMSPVPLSLMLLKISDKSVGYSVFRISKEMLYIPTTTEIKYKAKAVIDMFGYRFSQLIGSALLLPFLYFMNGENIDLLILAVFLALGAVGFSVARRYAYLRGGETPAVSASPGLAP